MPRRPRASRPKLSRIPGVKSPNFWNLVEGVVKAYPIRELRKQEKREPAGDPPSWWPGTRPEWAVYWALLILGLRPDVDFQYRARLPELERKRWGEVDFLLPDLQVAIEVQGEYFHYDQGVAQLVTDELKRAMVEGMGMILVWIDGEAVLADPLYYVREALSGRDHSRRGIP